MRNALYLLLLSILSVVVPLGCAEPDKGEAESGNDRPGTGSDTGRPGGNGDAGGGDDSAVRDADLGEDQGDVAADGEDSTLTDADGLSDTAPDVTLPDVDDDALTEGAGYYDDVTDTRPVAPELCPTEQIVPALCVAELADESTARLCDGFDNDCDGLIDEGCICKIGEVHTCFQGPPGRIGTGACTPGNQICITSEAGPRWGPCLGGVGPTEEVCDGLDDNCNGCVDEIPGCTPDVRCPGPDDPRVPPGQPFVDYPLRGSDFFGGEARTWAWTVTGGPCDGVLPTPSYSLTGANQETATFRPLLSGSYTVHMRVTNTDGGVFECTWIVHVVGPGLRVEMCYPESTYADLDLYLMGPGRTTNWYPPRADAFSPTMDACSWANCEAHIRGGFGYSRCDWGYANSPLTGCEGGPLGAEWRSLGYCSNPRLDIDNNLSEGTGLPENINVDNPRAGDNFRIMVQNFTGSLARPIVNVYCGGTLTASFGAAPDVVPNFQGTNGAITVGAMWRVADVTMFVDGDGATVGCEVTAIHPAGATSGYNVTRDDPTF